MTDHELTREVVYRTEPATPEEERRIEHHIDAFAPRVKHYPEPRVHFVLDRHQRAPHATVESRLQLGPLGPSLVSHQQGASFDQAVKHAIEDLERQLERHLAKQRGEPSFGVPSRRPVKRTAGEPSGEASP